MMLTKPRGVRLVFVAFVTAALLAGCAGSGDGPFVGTWGDSSDSTKPSLELASDGKATGTDGCNRLTGDWAEEGKTVTFSRFASTLMACEGMDTWLSNAATAKIQEDGKLALFGEDGTQIGTLSGQR